MKNIFVISKVCLGIKHFSKLWLCERVFHPEDNDFYPADVHLKSRNFIKCIIKCCVIKYLYSCNILKYALVLNPSGLNILEHH